MARRTKTRGVKQLEPGLYLVRATVTDPKTGKRVDLRREVPAASAIEAAAKRVEIRADWLADRTPHQRADRLRLGDAVTSWIASRARELKPSTAKQYATALDAWTDALGDYYLDALEPRDVQAALTRWVEAGLTTDTVNGRLRVLRTALRGLRVPGPVEGVRALRRAVRDDERVEDEGRGLDLAELRRLLAGGADAAGEAWWPLIATLAWTGIRWGEASALEWRDVDLDAGTIAIRRAVWRGKVGHPKAKASRREIVIPEPLAAVLGAHRKRMIRDQAEGVESGLVFPSPRTGKYPSNTGARKAMQRACAAAEVVLGKRPVLHCLRHSFNNALRQVASELVRQSLVGHADAEVGKRYSKVDLGEKREAVGAVVRLVKGGR